MVGVRAGSSVWMGLWSWEKEEGLSRGAWVGRVDRCGVLFCFDWNVNGVGCSVIRHVLAFDAA